MGSHGVQRVARPVIVRGKLSAGALLFSGLRAIAKWLGWSQMSTGTLIGCRWTLIRVSCARWVAGRINDRAQNQEVEFTGEKQCNATHRGTTDPKACLCNKGEHTEAKLLYIPMPCRRIGTVRLTTQANGKEEVGQGMDGPTLALGMIGQGQERTTTSCLGKVYPTSRAKRKWDIR